MGKKDKHLKVRMQDDEQPDKCIDMPHGDFTQTMSKPEFTQLVDVHKHPELHTTVVTTTKTIEMPVDTTRIIEMPTEHVEHVSGATKVITREESTVTEFMTTEIQTKSVKPDAGFEIIRSTETIHTHSDAKVVLPRPHEHVEDEIVEVPEPQVHHTEDETAILDRLDAESSKHTHEVITSHVVHQEPSVISTHDFKRMDVKSKITCIFTTVKVIRYVIYRVAKNEKQEIAFESTNYGEF